MARIIEAYFVFPAALILSACTGEVGADEQIERGSLRLPNAYSWDGSWEPGDDLFPIEGLLDSEYCDSHVDDVNKPTPVLPPGSWDWSDAENDLANWRNFEKTIGSFEALVDAQDRSFGWRLQGNTPQAVDFSGPAAYFEGSVGADILDLGKDGALHSFDKGDLADGPDILAFNKSWSLRFKTGSSATSGDGSCDNDLVFAGCEGGGGGPFKVSTTTIHTGPGRDLVIARDIERSAIDLGNGAGGRTDTIDPNDGDDVVLLHGNTYDARVFGGKGDDVAVWYIDENEQTKPYLGLNFFGGGSYGGALWSDSGTDRLVLVIPANTQIVTSTPTPKGALLVRASEGELIQDAPVSNDPFARYCIECGVGPSGRKTVILEYNSADGSVHSGYVYLTAFEELQIGVGPSARVYRLNDVAGTATLADDLAPFEPPAQPGGGYCQ